MAQMSAFTLAVTIVMGLLVGVAFEKGQVHLPHVIVGQMILRDFTMLKMFLSAASTSLLVNIILHFVMPDHLEDVRGKQTKTMTPYYAALGSAITGAGMSVSGSCPGTVFAQLGSGSPLGIAILIGGFFGAWIYGEFFRDLVGEAGTAQKTRHSKSTVDTMWGLPYFRVAVPLFFVLAGAIVVLELLFPYVEPDTASASALHAEHWSPIVAGMIIGGAQLPFILFLSKMLGSSTFYTAAVATVVSSVHPRPKSYWSGVVNTDGHWVQAVYLASALSGAFLSSTFSGNTFPSPPLTTYTVTMAFLGGVLVVFGSRMAGGCTSGHGISGFGALTTSAMTAVPSMFGSAIVTALILNAFGAYPVSVVA